MQNKNFVLKIGHRYAGNQVKIALFPTTITHRNKSVYSQKAMQ
jgi:hypothetical protein